MDALAVVQRLGGGKLLEELNEALAKTASEVVETGKPGVVTIQLKVSSKAQGDPMVFVEETISRAAPKKDPRAAYFFALQGELHKTDPRQPQMEFRAVDVLTGELRETDDIQQIREAR